MALYFHAGVLCSRRDKVRSYKLSGSFVEQIVCEFERSDRAAFSVSLEREGRSLSGSGSPGVIGNPQLRAHFAGFPSLKFISVRLWPDLSRRGSSLRY